MSAHKIFQDMLFARYSVGTIPDPGDGLKLRILGDDDVCVITSTTGTKTRVLPPAASFGVGTRVTLQLKSITSGQVNVADDTPTTTALTTAGDSATFRVKMVGTTKKWIVDAVILPGLTATAAELNQLHSQTTPKFVSGNAPVVVPAGTTTLTLVPATHAGRILNIASTGGLALTPPAATGTGDVYEFICSAAITGGSFTFDAKAGNASDVIYGWLQSYKATTFTPYPNASNSNLITFNGTTTGGAAIGDWFRVTDAALHVWKIEGFTVQSGSIATMFSNH